MDVECLCGLCIWNVDVDSVCRLCIWNVDVDCGCGMWMSWLEVPRFVSKSSLFQPKAGSL